VLICVICGKKKSWSTIYPMKIILESSRLLFREFTTGDADLIYTLNGNPEVVKYVHEEPTSTPEIALRSITERILPQYDNYGYGRWAVHLKDNSEFIGWCGLKYRPERRQTDLGYRFIRNFWGRGYATEAASAALEYAFGTLQLPAIEAMAHIDNQASLRVLEKCGMQFYQFERVDGCPVKTFRLFNPSGNINTVSS
jgi:ribosomal-protein-alanine N-acetyltransferase